MGSGKDTTGWIEFCIPLFRSLLLDALSGPIVKNRQHLEDLLFPHVPQFDEDLSQKSMRLSTSLISGLNGKPLIELGGRDVLKFEGDFTEESHFLCHKSSKHEAQIQNLQPGSEPLPE